MLVSRGGQMKPPGRAAGGKAEGSERVSYTMTFDASKKVSKQGGHHSKWIKHIARDVDRENGVEQRHSNKRIDPSRTQNNITMMNDGKGGYVRPENTRQVIAHLEGVLKGIETGTGADGKKRAMRKDAVVMRGVVLQLDPDWFKDHCPDWKANGLNEDAQRYTREMLAWAEDSFGQENIVMWSVHLDEDNPQLQVGMIPKTADGRLSQAAFFKGRAGLRQMHDSLRERLIAAGYDTSMERVTKDRHIRQMDDAAYKRYRDDLEAAEKGGAEGRKAVSDAKAQARQVLAGAHAEAGRVTDEAVETLNMAKESRARAAREEEAARDSRRRAEADEAAHARLMASEAAAARQAVEDLRASQRAMQDALAGLEGADSEYKEGTEAWLSHMDRSNLSAKVPPSQSHARFLATRPDLSVGRDTQPKRGLSPREKALRVLRDSQEAEKRARDQGMDFGR